MAALIIKGMDMPIKNGCTMLTIWPNGTVNAAVYTQGGRSASFSIKTAVPLPEGHGDLIDRDDVLLRVDCIGTNKFGMLDEDIRAFLKQFKPIVPAEGSGRNE